MSKLKTRVQRGLSRVGLYERVRGSIIYDMYWKLVDPALIEARQKEVAFYREILRGFRSGELVFDVGANHGAKTDVFVRLGARVIAIEPDESNQCVLNERFRRLRMRPKPVTVIGAALSDRSGVASFLIDQPGSAKNTLSSKWAETLRTDESRFGETLQFAQRREVRTTTLEELIVGYGPPFFVKIDVEGFELHVLRGLRQVVPYISFEVNLPDFQREGLECIELLGRLSSHGTFNYVVDVGDGLVMQEWLKACEFSSRFLMCAEKSIEVFWSSRSSG